MSFTIDELTGDAAELVNDGANSQSQYYNLRAYPVLLQLTVAAAAIFILIIFITFFCCIEIRRLVYRRLIAYSYFVLVCSDGR